MEETPFRRFPPIPALSLGWQQRQTLFRSAGPSLA
jgi:hypothetical protein